MTDRLMSAIDRYAELTPENPVLLAHGREPLTYSQLRALVHDAEGWFRANGFGVRSRIGTIFTDNFSAAAAFFAVSNSSVCVPLNPEFTVEELKYYIGLLHLDALLVQEEVAVELADVTAELGVGLVRWAFGERLDLEMKYPGKTRFTFRSRFRRGKDEDVALLLLTSGTTEAPKVIPRTHTEMRAAVENSVDAYSLTHRDRYFTTRPFFYNATITAMLAIVHVGGSAAFSQDNGADELLEAVRTFKPTWFSVSTPVYQSMVEELKSVSLAKDVFDSVRFFHSTGTPLPSRLAEEIETLWNIPVADTYGMTETGMLSCTYGSPKRMGSVGKVGRTQVAIMDKDGKLLPAGSPGEVAAKGTALIKRYENEPSVNREAFCNGWFRTGDYGFLDSEGYLYVTGRIKELINRGGQKISPYEIEKAILQHPMVSNAVVFPFPHVKLGEEIAAAVVLKDSGPTLQLKTMRGFLMEKIAHFKIPSKVFVVDRIPVGPTGKFQRNKLHEYFKNNGVERTSSESRGEEAVRPLTDLERRLAAIWKELLEVDSIGVRDDFFESGGDSIQVAKLYVKISEEWGCKIHITEFYREATIEKLAEFILDQSSADVSHPFLVPIQKKGSRPPLFCVHPIHGEVLKYMELAAFLGEEQPVYGLRFQPERLGDQPTIQSLASAYIRDIQSVQPRGPYLLAGYSFGGMVAFEIARQLKALGQEIGMVALIDTAVQELRTDDEADRSIHHRIRSILRGKRRKEGRQPPDASIILLPRAKRFTLDYFAGEILLFFAEENKDSIKSIATWAKNVDSLKVVRVPGDHVTIVHQPYVVDVSREIRSYLESALRGKRRGVEDDDATSAAL